MTRKPDLNESPDLSDLGRSKADDDFPGDPQHPEARYDYTLARDDPSQWVLEEPSLTYDLDFNDPELLASLIKTMVEMTPAAYLVLDKDYRVHYANEYFLKLRKLTADEVIGARCYDLANNGQICSICAVGQAIARGERQAVTRKDVLPDGTVHYIEDQALPLFKENGRDFDYILEIMIDRSRVMRLREEVNQAFHNVVRMLVSVLEKKDRYTSTHSADVSTISAKLARFIGLSEDEIYNISLGALLHDIGKVLIPDLIINKPGGLSEAEYNDMKLHPVESFNLVAGLEGFDDIKDICLRHHERWDGQGYPDGLEGFLTPLGAHIISLADTYDAMTSDRSYRRGLPHEEAIAEIKRCLGGQFHPELGAKFVAMATGYFNSRQELIAKDHKALADFLQKRPNGAQVERQLRVASSRAPQSAMSLDGGYRFNQELISQIFNHTPAFYAIISENLDLLYASETMARALDCRVEDLIGRKCYEINHKSMSCLMDGDDLTCPGLRALSSGQLQKGEVEEYWGGAAMSFEVYAAPITLLDRQGQSVNCILEIMFDRTDEVSLQRRAARDFRTLIQTLEALIERIDPADTGNSEAIIQQCDTLGEFLSRFQREIKYKYR